MPIEVTPAVIVPDEAMDERFVRSSGPGGQNVNKVSTAVELRVAVDRLALPPDARMRLESLAGQRLTSDGVLVIHAREHRTQAQNREAARARLVTLLRAALVRPRPRRPTRPSSAARERRLTAKKRTGAVKQRRQRRPDDE